MFLTIAVSSMDGAAIAILKGVTMNIYEKLNLVQAQLKAPKGQFNSFGGFKYRSLEDIVEGVKPLLMNYRLCLTISDSVKLIGDRFYIEATATLINVDKPEEKITTTALAREAASKKSFDESQITGATSSYARKYALNAMFSIDDTKDADFPIHNENKNNGKSQTQSQGHNGSSSNLTYSQVNYTNNAAGGGYSFAPPPPPTQHINNYPPADTVPNNSQPQQTQQQPNDDGRLSGKQYKFILSLMGNAKKSKEEMDQVCISSYGKTLQHLSKKDASKLIESLTAK